MCVFAFRCLGEKKREGQVAWCLCIRLTLDSMGHQTRFGDCVCGVPQFELESQSAWMTVDSFLARGMAPASRRT